jgi:hypothetical protein
MAMDGMDDRRGRRQARRRAAGEAPKGIFSGDSEGIEKRINAEAERSKPRPSASANRLPAMLASQQALARELPAFKPYATMDQRTSTTAARTPWSSAR